MMELKREGEGYWDFERARDEEALGYSAYLDGEVVADVISLNETDGWMEVSLRIDGSFVVIGDEFATEYKFGNVEFKAAP